MLGDLCSGHVVTVVLTTFKRLAIERIVKLLRRIHADDLAADLITEYKLPEQIQ